MPAERQDEANLVLAPNEYAHILNRTDGVVMTHVGPLKSTLQDTEHPVAFNTKSKTFDRCGLDRAKHLFPIAPEGWYLILKNPGGVDNNHPKPKHKNDPVPMDVGSKINIPGPMSFPMWPGQMVEVRKGHHLKSNQYLLARVYNDEAAEENLGKAIVRSQADSEGGKKSKEPALFMIDEHMSMGKLMIIKGTQVSFYIPPTGIEVVANDDGDYVREALTLEKLEYCILKDEDGNKRFVQGPAVVFPEPTEQFVRKSGEIKFRAIELDSLNGIYIKVIEDYKEGKNEYKAGDELFLTGKDAKLYFPRREHAFISYGDKGFLHSAIAIPKGNGRYVLNRETGDIRIEQGPSMCLPDPRKEVVVRRLLDDRTCDLLYPGNGEAKSYNQSLMDVVSTAGDFVEEGELSAGNMANAPRVMYAMTDSMTGETNDPALYESKSRGGTIGARRYGAATAESPEDVASAAKHFTKMAAQQQPEKFAGDEFGRPENYKPARSIILDAKYEGVVKVNVWTGYAVLIISSTGERRVEVGPKSILLDYDETCEAVTLSTGTPKSDDQLMHTAYLRVLNNKVSDKVFAETKDLFPVEIKLSYRLNFEGKTKEECNKWFDVENYVKFLTQHMRSLIRNVAKQHGVEDFYANSINILRDAILGTAEEGKERVGRKFEENNLRIYDVEVFNVHIKDGDVASSLKSAKQDALKGSLQLERQRDEYSVTQELEELKRKILDEHVITNTHTATTEMARIKRDRQLALEKILTDATSDEARREIEKSEHEFEMEKVAEHLEMEVKELIEKAKVDKGKLDAEAAAVVKKSQAWSPQLVAALERLGEDKLLSALTENMSPMAILGGESVADVLNRMVKGTGLESLVGMRMRNVGAELRTATAGKGKHSNNND